MRKVIVLQESAWMSIVNFEEGLDFYYKNLDCDLIDIVRPYALIKKSLKFNDFILIVDDEGLLKANPKVNVFATLAYGSTICGKVMVAKEEYTEDDVITVGLTEDEIELFNEGLISILDDIKLNR